MLKSFGRGIIYLSLFLVSCVSVHPILESKPTALYQDITFEVIHLENSKPTNMSLNFLEENIKKYKLAENVNFVIRKISAMPEVWDTSKLKKLEDGNRTLNDAKLKDNHLIIYIACIPGPYKQGDRTNVIGLQYRNTSFAIFIDDNRKCDGSVLLHEFGHILRIAANRKNPVNPKRPHHCNNKKCVMFWQTSKPNKTFDDECQHDIIKLIDSQSRKLG